MEGKFWFLFDLGDSRRMNDDFDNGIFFGINELKFCQTIKLVIVFDGKLLACWLNDVLMGKRELKGFEAIKGDGDLIIGDAGWPHGRDSWPVNDTHPFFGKLDYLEIYDSVDIDLAKAKFSNSVNYIDIDKK